MGRIIWTGIPLAAALWMQLALDLPWWTVLVVGGANVLGYAEALVRRD